MADKISKTNAMRILDRGDIPYETLAYTCDGVNFDGCLVADQVGLPRRQVFKTLVTCGERGSVAVACIPVDRSLDLKALAAAAKVKRLEMVHPDELKALTGYVRGGCSPIGMKKRYPLFVDQSAWDHESIAVSAGVRGLQLLLHPDALVRAADAAAVRLCQDV